MPRYDYRCPANGEIVELSHTWSERVTTWGELCARAGIDPGVTPADSPVERLIAVTRLMRRRGDGAEGDDIGGSHPAGCSCCVLPSNSGIDAFQQKLRSGA